MELPSKTTEATIQAELYRQLHDAGVGAALEVYITDRCRADIVLHKRRQIYAAIEVKRDRLPKRYTAMTHARPHGTRQRQQYADAGIPWRYCEGWRDIGSCVKWALYLHSLTK